MLLAVKLCVLLTLLAVEWGSIDAVSGGSLDPLFLAAIFAPLFLLSAFVMYYTLKMRAA